MMITTMTMVPWQGDKPSTCDVTLQYIIFAGCYMHVSSRCLDGMQELAVSRKQSKHMNATFVAMETFVA